MVRNALAATVHTALGDADLAHQSGEKGGLTTADTTNHCHQLTGIDLKIHVHQGVYGSIHGIRGGSRSSSLGRSTSLGELNLLRINSLIFAFGFGRFGVRRDFHSLGGLLCGHLLLTRPGKRRTVHVHNCVVFLVLIIGKYVVIQFATREELVNTVHGDSRHHPALDEARNHHHWCSDQTQKSQCGERHTDGQLVARLACIRIEHDDGHHEGNRGYERDNCNQNHLHLENQA